MQTNIRIEHRWHSDVRVQERQRRGFTSTYKLVCTPALISHAVNKAAYLPVTIL